MAPSKVRADQVVQVYVVLFKLYVPTMTITASIMKDNIEYANLQQSLQSGATRLLQMKMPSYAESGNYTLRIRGSTDTSISGVLFENETSIEFESKHVSVFIQTDKYLYNRRQWISYRIFAVKPNMMLVDDGSVIVYVKDPNGRILRRWLNKQLYNGHCEDRFWVDFPVVFGMWTIEVDAFGHTYKQQVKVENWFGTRFDVNLTMPTYVFDSEYAVAGAFNANMTNHMPLKGNATVICEIVPPATNKRQKRFADWVRPPDEGGEYQLLKKTYSYFHGVNSFLFSLDEIREYVGDNLAGTKLNIYATVFDWYFMEEKTTKSTVTIYSSLPKVYFLGGTSRTFKPRQQFDCYAAVHLVDGSQLPGQRRQIMVQRITRKTNGATYSTDMMRLIPDDSIVKYSFVPEEDDQFIRVRVSYEGLSNSWKELTAIRHYAHSDNYISITSSTEDPKVDTYMVFTVRVTAYVPQVYYQIISGGNIVTVGLLFMDYQQKTFSVALSRDMIPECKLLVFCVLNTGEVLADAINFHVKGVRSDQVQVSINKGKDFTSNTLELTARTDPGSFTVFSGVDYDMYARGAATFLTEYDVEQDLKSYGAHTNSSFSHTWWDDPLAGRKSSVHFTAPTYAIDTNTTFAFAGMKVFTDADLIRIPEALMCNSSLGFLPCFDGTCFEIDRQCDSIRDCEDGADEMGCFDDGALPESPVAFSHLGRIGFHYDDATWLWHNTYTKPNGRIDLKLSAPRRPNTWLVGAVALNRETGMSFSQHQARIDVTRQFYITVECPGSAFKGEQLGVQVAIYNYWDQPIEAIIRLRDSDDYRFIHVEDFGRVSSYAPRISRGDVQTMVFLRPNEARYIHFPVLPIKIGSVTIIIDADSIVNKQTMATTVSISYDGVKDYYQTPYFVDLINSGSMLIPDLRIIVPERFIHPDKRYHLYVPGSPKATVSVVGDVMGPGFTSNNLGSWNLLRKSSGQGETYIFDVVIDVIWLRFFKACNQLSNERLQTSLGEINKDLTIMLSYGKPDGFFVMFRNRSPPSVFITAFALETLAYSIEAEWEQTLYVDVDYMHTTAIWLANQQDKDTGAFSEPEIWFDRKMLDPGNMTNPNGQSLNLSLTAFVTIAMANSRERLAGDAAALTMNAINRAAEYLFSNLNKLWDPFQICIVTYALHVANHKGKGEAFYLMEKVKRTDEYVYWSHVAIPKNPFEYIDNVMYLYPRLEHPQEGKAIQGTAYALLVYILNNRYYDSFPIMKWLQTQRNTDGSFAGPQDTVVALRALAAFANRDTNRDLYNMVVKIQSTGTADWSEDVYLRKGSYVTYSTFSLPDVYGSVRAVVQGTGYAILQLGVEVNVEYPFLMKQPLQRAFDLDIEHMAFSGKNASRMDMTVCTRWLRTDLSPRSGFVMLEADIPTGYKVGKQVLRDEERAGPYDIWKRSRFTRQKVYLHLDYIGPEKTCFKWFARRWYPVANGTIQHRIRIYEVQEPGNHNTTLYTTYDLFHNHMCLVCGSFQCPYCINYNAATPPPSIHNILMLMTATLSTVLLWTKLQYVIHCTTG